MRTRSEFDARRAEAAELMASGSSVGQVAERLSLSRYHVTQLLATGESPLARRLAMQDEVLRLHAERPELPAAALATRVGVSVASVYRVLKLAGQGFRGPQARHSERDRQLLRCHEAGATNRELAERFGLTPVRVFEIVREQSARQGLGEFPELDLGVEAPEPPVPVLTSAQGASAVELYRRDRLKYNPRGIARELGVDMHSVGQHLVAVGVF